MTDRQTHTHTHRKRERMKLTDKNLIFEFRGPQNLPNCQKSPFRKSDPKTKLLHPYMRVRESKKYRALSPKYQVVARGTLSTSS